MRSSQLITGGKLTRDIRSTRSPAEESPKLARSDGEPTPR